MRERTIRSGACLIAAALALAACEPASGSTLRVAGGDADRGKAAIVQFGCGGCHLIPGVRDATGMVGPPLIGWSKRVYIAGEIPNTTQNLVRWIEAPPSIEPATAMPIMGVSPQQARDIAAYLYTLR